VPMLFVLPARDIPLAVAGALVLARCPEYARRKVPPERVVIPVGNSWFAFGPALVFLAFGEPSARPRAWAVLALALIAQIACDFVASIVREWLALRIPPRDLLKPLIWVFSVDGLLAPVGLAAAVGSLATKAALFLPLPLLALTRVFARERQRRLDHMLELSTAYRGTALLLADVIEDNDQYTGSHSREVVDLVLAVCDKLGLEPRLRRVAEFAALLHDVGKIRIPSEIINKPGQLNPRERALINTHTIEGENLLRPIGGLLAEVGGIVRSCHEHYDGTGYPDGLAAEAIPLIARIVSCCDAFNAMTTDRSYDRARTPQAALAELQAKRATQFDPDVVDALTRIYASPLRSQPRGSNEMH